MIAIIGLLSLISILSLFLHWHKSSNASTKLPPHPPGLPLFGNLHQLGALPHRSLNSLSKKYGPLILLNLGGGAPTVVVSSAELAEQVMKVQDLIFASRPPSSIANRLLYNSTDVAFSPYNDYWRQMKMICIVHLLSSKRVRSFRHVRTEEVALLIEDIRASSSSPLTSTVNLSAKLVALTNNIICRVALGTKFSGERRFGEMLDEFVALLGSFSAADFVPLIGGWIDVLSGLDKRVRKTSKDLDELLEQVLEMHSSKPSNAIDGDDEDGDDFVDVLLSLKDINDTVDTPIPLHKDHIKALILDMFAAGTHTTFATLEWAMAELIKNPTLMHKVQRELREVVGYKGVVEEENINKFTYLKAIVKETLRLHVPVALLVPRVATEGTMLKGYHIPLGTKIMINAWAIARDPKYWDKPEEFWPDRFTNNNVDFTGQHFQLTPFGAGRRICPGMGFAITAIECVLANLLYHFDWEVPEKMKEKVLDMRESRGITIHKKSALILTAILHSAECSMR